MEDSVMKCILSSLLIISSLVIGQAAIAGSYTVSTAVDDGSTGSLRWAVNQINLSTDVNNTIDFALPAGTTVISLGSRLPELSKPVTLHAPSGGVTLELLASSQDNWALASTAPLTISGDMILHSTGSRFETGIYSSGNLILTGPFTSTIRVESNASQGTFGASARGIQAEGDVTINGDLGGIIETNSPRSNAWGVNTFGPGAAIRINGSVTGIINTTTYYQQSIGIGTLSTTIPSGGVWISGGLAPESRITAIAGHNFASAIFAGGGGLTIGGDLAGIHSAKALNFARTFYAYNTDPYSADNLGLTVHGAVLGTITAEVENNRAFGLVSRLAPLYLGKGIGQNGSVTATAANNSAYAIYAFNGDVLINGNIEGMVTAVAGNATAVGIGAAYNSISDISGLPIIGLPDRQDLAPKVTINGEISGQITSRSGSLQAYAIYADNAISISGGIAPSGQVLAQAGGFAAGGLVSNLGGIYGANPQDPLKVAGSIQAVANGAAAGVISQGPVNLEITGLVSGIDLSGQGLGYAIRSGMFGPTGAFTPSLDVDDQVTISQWGKVVGNIDLGRGDDFLLIRDRADISSAPLITGGDGDESHGRGDNLVFRQWQGVYGEALQGWERIDILDASSINLGLSKTIAPTPGELLLMTIDKSSVVSATGDQPGRYVIDGTVINMGRLELRDGSADDHVTISKAFSGSGEAGFDVALGIGQNRTNYQETLDLITVGPPGGAQGTVAGRQGVIVNNISPGGTILETTGKGILVVDVNGRSVADAFYLDGSNDFREARVQLLQGGADGIGDSWYLVIEKSAAPIVHGVLQQYGLALRDLTYDSIPRFHERQAYGWSTPDQEREPRSVWGRTSFNSFSADLDSNGRDGYGSGHGQTLQAGADLFDYQPEDIMYRGGVFLGTGTRKVDSEVPRDVHIGSVSADSFGGGLYGSIEARDRWYVEGVLQLNDYDIRGDFFGGRIENSSTTGVSASLEGGLYYRLTDTFYLEPQVQLVWQWIDDYTVETDTVGTARIGDFSGLKGRLGLTGSLRPQKQTVYPFFEINVLREFGDDPQVSYLSIDRTYTVDSNQTSIEGVIGVATTSADPDDAEFYIKAGAMHGLDGYDYQQFTVIAGVRIRW
jgi:outer membrane autotransporter protein